MSTHPVGDVLLQDSTTQGGGEPISDASAQVTDIIATLAPVHLGPEGITTYRVSIFLDQDIVIYSFKRVNKSETATYKKSLRCCQGTERGSRHHIYGFILPERR